MFLAPTTETQTAVSINHLLNVIQNGRIPEKHFKHLRFLFFQTFAHAVYGIFFFFFLTINLNYNRQTWLPILWRYSIRVLFNRNPL